MGSIIEVPQALNTGSLIGLEGALRAMGSAELGGSIGDFLVGNFGSAFIMI